MYCHGLGLRVLGSFEDHHVYDGVMLGFESGAYHFEFTQCRGEAVLPRPTVEDLVVFYVPSLSEWQSDCRRIVRAGFKPVTSSNPYWNARGRTYEDPDGYRIVLEQSDWGG